MQRLYFFSQDQLRWRLDKFRKYHALRFLSALQPLYFVYAISEKKQPNGEVLKRSYCNNIIPLPNLLFVC